MSKHLLLRTIIILARGEYIVVALQPASLINFLNIYAHHPEERIMRVMWGGIWYEFKIQEIRSSLQSTSLRIVFESTFSNFILSRPEKFSPLRVQSTYTRYAYPPTFMALASFRSIRALVTPEKHNKSAVREL